MDLLKLLEELEDLVEESSTMPFSNKVIIDKNDIYEIIKDIRMQIPKEIKDAKQITSDKETIIAEAQKESENIIANAKKYAQDQIDHSEIVKEAQKKSERMMEEANKVSEEIREGSRAYADEILEKVQNTIESSLTVILENRNELQNMK